MQSAAPNTFGTLTISMANTKELWAIYDFEQDMFKEMLRLGTTVECQKFPQSVQHAIVESMLLHLRILVDILLSRESDKDDIKLTELLPGFQSPLIKQLKATYGSSKKVGSPCWNLNKRLAHATQVRSSRYSYDYLLQPLVRLVMPLLDKVAEARQVSVHQNAQL